MAAGYGVLDGIVHIEEGPKVRRRRRILYATCSTALSAIVLAAVLDAFTSVAVYGVESERTQASGGGYELGVRYGSVTRPALATPFDIEIVRSGGFNGPVTVAVSSDYLAMWDANALDPEPAESTRDSRFTYWTFDPPADGDTLKVSFDARIEPAVQQGREGTVAVLDASGAVAVDVEFETWVWP